MLERENRKIKQTRFQFRSSEVPRNERGFLSKFIRLSPFLSMLISVLEVPFLKLKNLCRCCCLFFFELKFICLVFDFMSFCLNAKHANSVVLFPEIYAEVHKLGDLKKHYKKSLPGSSSCFSPKGRMNKNKVN